MFKQMIYVDCFEDSKLCFLSIKTRWETPAVLDGNPRYAKAFLFFSFQKIMAKWSNDAAR